MDVPRKLISNRTCFILAVLTVCFMVSSAALVAQNRVPSATWSPHVLSEGLKSGNPPPEPIRQPAEFEPMQGVIIGFPFSLTFPIIAEMSEDVEVVTIVLNANQKQYVENKYLQNGVNLNNCSFLFAPIEVSCTRDYGPWFIITGDDEQGIMDFHFAWPEPGNNAIPKTYARDQQIPLFHMGLVHEGGNYMTDGLGISASTNLVWEVNPKLTPKEINERVEDFLGIHTYHVVPHALGSWLKHIDCWAKYLSPDTIIITEVPPDKPNYQALESAAVYFANQISSYGTPYEIVRVYCPKGEPYTNALILNNKVLVPIMGSDWDDDAIATYEEAMPGYEVLGFKGSWSTNGALHCQTMGITDRFMLYIRHTPMLNRPPLAQGFPIEAEIVAYSGQAFTGGTPEVCWKTTGGWNSVPMTHSGGNIYHAYIPSQPVGTEVQYYIHVEDTSNRSENHPYIGESGAHCFKVNDLGLDRCAISTIKGGKIQFYMNAGTANGNRDYFLLGSVSGTEPGIVLPGGQVLPLNWDLFTALTYVLANTACFSNFKGTLDGSGVGSAELDTLGPLPRETAGIAMNFAFTLLGPFDFVSNSVGIKIVE